MKSAKKIILDGEFTGLTYGEVIQEYILKSEDPICEQILKLKPEIDKEKLKNLLARKVRCNAAILPLLITPEGTFVLGGLSQREGSEKRGVLVNAMGGVDPEDNSMLDAALRELDEELGKAAAEVFSPHIPHSVFHVRNALGKNLEEVASNIEAYLSGDKRSISFYGLILTPVFLSDEEAQNLLEKSNCNLAVNQTIYQKAVEFYYQNGQADVDFVSLAKNILPFITEHTKKNVSKFIDDYELDRNPKKLRHLVHYLIEITENKNLILLDLQHLCELYVKQDGRHERLWQGHDVNKSKCDIFVPSLMDAIRIIKSIGLSPGVLASNTNPLIKKLYQTQQNTRTSFTDILSLIRARVSDNLFKTTPHQSPVSKNVLYIAHELLFSSEWRNPRSLSMDGQKQVALGSLYHQFTHEAGTRLTAEEIPSHVEAASTKKSRVNTLLVKPGTTLWQYCRPNGWIGDYYTGDERTQPDELGISGKVSDPSDPDKLVERVKLTLVTREDQTINAAVSIAKQVEDSWSVQGKTVRCKGGGRQIYMPLTSPGKQNNLVILLPDDAREQNRVRAVAKKNGVTVITQQELDKRNIASNVLPDFEKLPTDPNKLQQLAFDAFKIGNIEQAKSALQQYITLTDSSNNGITEARARAKAILACIYALSGQMIEANKTVKSFEHFASESSDSNEKKLLFLVHFHLARANVIPAQAMALLNNCLQELGKVSLFSKETTENYRSLINLELAIQHNRLASQYSDEITFNDFDENGRQRDNKFKNASEALTLLNKIKVMQFPPQEQIGFLLEKAFANHQVKNYTDALKALTQANCLLDKEINSNTYPDSMMEELKLQQLSIKLGIGLCLARLTGTYQSIPPGYGDIEPVSYLIELSEKLNQTSPMKVALLFKRWVGPNANNLFIQGWYDQQSRGKDQGTNLISVYRKYIPLDINNIVRNLEENTLLELDLAYLGMPQPAGINNEDFKRLCHALAKNTSLKSLFIRKFSAWNDGKDPASQRAKLLFESLNTAQNNGQKLNYFSCSGSRFNSIEEKQACIRFLENNTSIRILQPSLYDFKEPTLMEEMANAIGNHPALTTLLTGIFKCKGAGEMIYNAGMSSDTLRFVYPFPGTIDPDNDKEAFDNNSWIKELRSSKQQASQTGSVQFIPSAPSNSVNI